MKPIAFCQYQTFWGRFSRKTKRAASFNEDVLFFQLGNEGDNQYFFPAIFEFYI